MVWCAFYCIFLAHNYRFTLFNPVGTCFFLFPFSLEHEKFALVYVSEEACCYSHKISDGHIWTGGCKILFRHIFHFFIKRWLWISNGRAYLSLNYYHPWSFDCSFCHISDNLLLSYGLFFLVNSSGIILHKSHIWILSSYVQSKGTL